MNAEKRITETVADGITLIHGLKHECCMWLVEGRDSALLIDTGIGWGGVRELVEELTSLPYAVVNTHGHGDHSGGNYEFDRVCMHTAAEAWARDAYRMTHGIADRKTADEVRRKILSGTQEIVEIEEGHVFSLGGRSLRVYYTPGHSLSDVTLIDDRTGLAFCGDLILHRAGPLLTDPEQVPVGQFAQSLKKLAAIPGITGFCSGHDHHLIPKEFLTSCMVCADSILNDTVNIEHVDAGLPRDGLMCLRATVGDCSIRFFDKLPWRGPEPEEPTETPAK